MTNRLASTASLCVGLLGLLTFQTGNTAYSQSNNIKNDRFWDTVDGQPIYSQGGGIFRFQDPQTRKEKYFWYGVHYQQTRLTLPA